MNIWKVIYADYSRYRFTGGRNRIMILFFNIGFIFTVIYRLNNSLYFKSRKIPIINKLVSLHCMIWLKLSQVISGLSIPIGTEIGKGILIGHVGPIIINNQAIIGENCNLGPMVIIGYGRHKGEFGVPKIGNEVFIGSGAKIFGPITIGNNVAIGANSVVNFDVPDEAVVGGNPAKILNYKGSYDYVQVK